MTHEYMIKEGKCEVRSYESGLLQLSIFQTYRLLLPLWWPIIKHELSDVTRALAGAKQVLPGLAADEDQA